MILFENVPPSYDKEKEVRKAGLPGFLKKRGKGCSLTLQSLGSEKLKTAPDFL